ncbi:MAG: autotransporter outer membrane beta-barrel domain-containing protein [Hyphomicrobiales bacterium]|nr:autotransporter outer membrane beta-barrel domain-containing protein [Hyphomicrobiales bacterium]
MRLSSTAVFSSICVAALLLGSPAKAQQAITNPTGVTVSDADCIFTLPIITGRCFRPGLSVDVFDTNGILIGSLGGSLIIGKPTAISLLGETGVATVTEEGGTVEGSIIGSGIARGDVLNLRAGEIILSGAQSISGFGTYNQSGGILVFDVTQSTAAGTYPTLNAGTINLRGGTFEIAPDAASFQALAIQHTTVFKNVIMADPPLSGGFASVTSAIPFFTASLSPDSTTPNALDATLLLNETALAASAQDLTQDWRLGLDAPRVLTQAVQDRLVANGGALGEEAPDVLRKGPASFSFGNAQVWARGFDQFGSATASAASAGVGYNINRAAPFIAGVDWRLDNNIMAGVAATYVATSARFKDGSSTNVSSYQGAVYAGWAGGPWYALGSVVLSFNDFSTSRLLTPFGLPADATSSPSGQSYQGHAEAGYRWELPAGSVTMSVTPYAALDYVNAHISNFSENGGFGALSVNSTDNNSFQTTLGIRLTSRIAIANMGTLIPQLRLGWSHEFLDASQQIAAALVGVPGSRFTSTGILFGRDAALIGAGFSMELSPDAKVFVDYDGRLVSRVQEHSVSGGLRVRF